MKTSPRFAPFLLVCLLAFQALIAGCGGEPPDIPISDEDHIAPPKAPSPPSNRAPQRSPALRAIAWTADGDVAVIDAEHGFVIASSAGAHLGGARDVVIDDAGSRAVVFEGDDEATWGEIASYPLRPSGVIGARAHRTYVDGDARLLAVPGGTAVFSDGVGPRWKVLRDDGEESVGIAMPRPASITMRRQGAGWRIGSLGYVDGAPRSFLEIDAAIEEHGSLGVLPSNPLELASSDAPSARSVEITRRYEVILDVAREGLALTRIADGKAGDTTIVRLREAPHRIEAAVLAGDDLIAVLTSGPSQVVFVALEARAAHGARAVAVVDLPGKVRVEDRFFSRDLTLVGAKLFAATDAGVFALSMLESDGGYVAAINRSFEGASLRGPVAALP